MRLDLRRFGNSAVPCFGSQKKSNSVKQIYAAVRGVSTGIQQLLLYTALCRLERLFGFVADLLAGTAVLLLFVLREVHAG